jgi:hypothetical protein
MNMSSNNNDRDDRLHSGEVDDRALWERPAFRRLVANYAEAGGLAVDDGNCMGGQSGHSCKT